ncbi:hypothetical protein Xen7305DRAFT_00045220 [Xenococcus sp. PCC 7305]|uniref:hypothetical protein n=1 Tax=Xenococcus sp. PCC 7305 TaxID=102125 RepID=UPI0002ACCF41|nr:hypothetical protein [Xenococcus sp. PCC 7305]ELS04786.1 hypothetical protein Xen7305DRAFT_00045220 [Xenococcus sp. PCC 7305]
MSNDFERIVKLELYIKAAQPELMTGLDELLRLGLIEEDQIIKLCRENLTCTLPVIKLKKVAPQPPRITPQPEPALAETAAIATVVKPKLAKKPNLVIQVWQAFLDELSIRWLLFLGIFLVVISSAVLAASKWDNFPAFGQYLILLAYTLSFCVIGFWLGKQDNLKLTSQTLKNVSVLLVPINFWAMSSFGLGFNIIEWLIIAVSSISLTGITFLKYKDSNKITRFWFIPIFLLLSYLHLGWAIDKLPLGATYVGISVVAGSYYWLRSRASENFKITNSLFLLSTWLLLLARTIFTYDSVKNLGLAIALGGWLLAIIYLNQKQQINLEPAEESSANIKQVLVSFFSKIFQPISLIIILFAWLVSVGGSAFWQTTAINILAIHLFSQTLYLYWRKRDLTAIFFIGLQGLFVAKELIPLEFRKNVINLGIQLSNNSSFPESIYGITLFPYVLLFVAIATWLYRQEKPKLARYSELLNLLFAIVLTRLALHNSTWLTCNLLLSTLTLVYISYIRKPIRIWLIYFAHALGLVTIASALNLIFPHLRSQSWGYIALLFMTIEWLIYLRRVAVRKSRYVKYWFRSSWYFGLLLGVISYISLLSVIEQANYDWVWLWSVAPLFLTIIAKNSRGKRREIARNFSWIALFCLQVLTFWQPETRTLGLAVATGLLAFNTSFLRFDFSLVYATHGLGLLTICSAIAWLFPSFKIEIWGCILLALAILEWFLFIFPISQPPSSSIDKYWHRSNWHYGLLLAIASYLGFLWPITDTQAAITKWGAVWLLIPIMLSVVARYMKGKTKIFAAFYSSIALILVQLLTLWQPETRLLGLAVATILMVINSYYLRYGFIAAVQIGFGLCLITDLLEKYVSDLNWLIVSAIAVWGLYAARKYLIRSLPQEAGGKFNRSKIFKKYIQAADYWAIALMASELGLLYWAYLKFASSPNAPILMIDHWQYLVAVILIGAAIAFRYWRQPHAIALYGFVGTVELAVSSLIVIVGGNSLAIATANITLALLSLWLINWLSDKSVPIARLYNLPFIPIIYAVLAIIWRLRHFTSSTGLITLGAAITGIGISNYRGKDNKILRYISLVGITLAIYELVIYQMSQFEGGNAADGFTIWAFVAAAIALIYRVIAFWHRKQGKASFANFSLEEIVITANIHWVISNLLLISAVNTFFQTGLEPGLTPLAIAIGMVLGLYAIAQSRSPQFPNSPISPTSLGVYLGLGEIVAITFYARSMISKLSIFDPWWVVLTCVVGLVIYRIPWQKFGWQENPWRHFAIAMPIFISLVTAETISYFSLGIAALFYLYLAYYQKNLRWSYFSLGFIDWAIARFAWEYDLRTIWFACIIGLSILYIAQFDAYFVAHRKEQHYARLAGSGLICLVAMFYQDTGVIPGVISAIAIFAGLGLRIRAFLFVGTITFILTIVYQLVILVFTYSFLKWIIGLIAGIVLISIAANFESKRDRLTNQLQSYVDRLKDWQ